jgi:hypothetical protein
MAETANKEEVAWAGKDKGRILYGEELGFDVTEATFQEIFNFDIRQFKGRISIGCVNEGSAAVDVQVTTTMSKAVDGVVDTANEIFIQIPSPDASEDGVLATGAGSSKVFVINPLIRWTGVRVEAKETVPASNSLVNFWIIVEEF